MKKKKTNNRILIVVASLVLVALVSVVVVKAQGVSFWDKVAQYAGQIIGQNVNDKLDTSGILEEPTFGAMPGSELFQPDFTVNGVRTYSYSVGMTNATNTPCFIKTPPATTTPAFISVYVKFATTSASFIDLAYSTTRYASTTSLGYLTLAAGAGGTLIASTTNASWGIGALTGRYLPPNTYLMVKLAAANGLTTGTGYENMAPVGVCKAQLIEVYK